MENQSGHRRHLYLAAFIVNICYTACGCVFSWTSPTIPKLMQPGSRLPITEEQGSWIGSIIAFGGTIGPIVAGKLLDNLGRKWTILINASLLLIAWIILLLANCVEVLYAGRFIGGFAVSVLFMALINYIAEVSDDNSRSFLSTTSEFSLSVGFNFQYFVGPFVSYEQLIILSSLFPIIFICIFIWLPETPYYLILKGRKEEAIKSLHWFRGNISLECAEKESVLIESTIFGIMKEKPSFWELLKIPGNRKGLYIACVLMAAQQFSGINALQLYSELLFVHCGTKLSAAYCTMIVGANQFLASAVAGPISKRFGYKRPLLVTCALIAVEHFLLGLFTYYMAAGKDVSAINWVPILCLVFYMLVYSASLGPMPWGITGEIFATNFKAVASSIVTVTNFSTTFIVAKFFTNINIMFGMYVSFWIFAISMVMTFFFILFVLPDTKGMSLQEVQDKLNKSCKSHSDVS